MRMIGPSHAGTIFTLHDWSKPRGNHMHFAIAIVLKPVQTLKILPRIMERGRSLPF